MSPRDSISKSSLFLMSAKVRALRCTAPGTPCDSIREAVLTVSPNRQKRGMRFPTAEEPRGAGGVQKAQSAELRLPAMDERMNPQSTSSTCEADASRRSAPTPATTCPECMPLMKREMGVEGGGTAAVRWQQSTLCQERVDSGCECMAGAARLLLSLPFPL